MSRIHSLKIMPGSEGEQYFMSLLNQVDVKHESVICRLGYVFGTPYNEYILSDGLFNIIKEHLLEKKGLSLNG